MISLESGVILKSYLYSIFLSESEALKMQAHVQAILVLGEDVLIMVLSDPYRAAHAMTLQRDRPPDYCFLLLHSSQINQ